jgi:periplasmic protein TonB
MKKAIAIIFLLNYIFCFSQTDTAGYAFVDPETPAEYPGGVSEMSKFIMKNLHYPAAAREAGISGKSYLKFIVNEDGTISNIDVLKKVAGCPECDAEVVRVIKLMPKWKAATVNNKAIKSYFSLPLNICGMR